MIEFDPDKDAENRVKHGITLAAAVDLLNSRFLVEQEDDRFDYGEVRTIATGLIQGREFVCVYTMREDVYRVISLRLATKGERDAFHKALAGDRGGASKI